MELTPRTVGGLREAVKVQKDKTLTYGMLKIKLDDNGDVNILTLDNDILAWVRESIDNSEALGKAVGVFSERLFEMPLPYFDLIKLVNGTLPNVKEFRLEKPEPKEDTEKYLLKGKVEAYESILIGRSVNVSK